MGIYANRIGVNKLKDVKKKSVGVLMLGIALIAVILLTGIKDLSSTYALGDNQVFSLYIPEGTAAAPGDKVYVELHTDQTKWNYISLSMRSTTSNDDFIVYLKDIKTSKPYFILPDGIDNSSNSKTGVKVGETYELRNIFLFPACKVDSTENCDESNVQYTTYKADDTTYIDLGNRKYVTVKEKNNTASSNLKINNFILKDSGIYLNERAYLKLDYTGDADKAYIYVVNKTDNKYLTI